MSSAVVKHPLVLWAQRSPHLYLAVEVEDMNIEELTIEEDKFKIKGKKGNDKYEADLQFFGKLNGTELRKIATDRRVEFVIPKEKEEWWPRLLKEKTKVAWIKVDFDKWKDEDEEKEDDGGGGGAPFGGMDFSSFGMPSGGKGFDDLDMDDEGENLDDMGDLEDVDDDELHDSPSKKLDQNGEGKDPASEEKGAEVETSTSTGKE
uniref:CS domain-containing protein n=1 Tax=Globodera pallida TaxID=36090 RepID=A0A183CLS9_GLOPA